MRKPISKSNPDWLNEIAEAYIDAKEAIPFGPLTGTKTKESDLFHMAPMVCLKFRGIAATKTNEQKATEAALSSYVANENANDGILKRPAMGFAFCYVLAHYGLGLVDEEQCEKVLTYVEANLDQLEKRIKT